MLNTTMHTKVNRYLMAIRNTQKRRYAYDYADWLFAHLPTDHVEFGYEPTVPSSLSYMAAQAVRLELHSLIGVTP